MRTKETIIRHSEKVLSKNPGVCSSEVEKLMCILSRGPFDMRHGVGSLMVLMKHRIK